MTDAPDQPSDAVPPDDPRILGLRRIVWVMDRLRGSGGCPWDQAQDPSSLRAWLLEETYELLEALDREDAAAIREELGDLLFQVVFQAHIAEEEGSYTLGDVAEDIARKLVGRHPHVFERGQELEDPQQVTAAWWQHKRREGRRSVLDGVPLALPALLRAWRVQEKAAGVGFDWPDAGGPLEKVGEELAELRRELERGDPRACEAELGDLLFSLVNLARHLGVNPEDALRTAVARFEARFRRIEARAERLEELDLAALDRLWDEVKAEESGETRTK